MPALHGRIAPGPHARFSFALAASAGLHVVLSSTLGDLPDGSAGRPFSSRLTVRLELHHPSGLLDQPDAAARAPTAEMRITRRAGEGVKQPVLPGQLRAAPPGERPAQQDTAVYAVHELDVLPRPARALDIVPTGTEDYRVELVIDEHGVVQRLALVASAAPRGLEQALRLAFAEMPFVPARKNGRAVRSRIVLQVRAGTEAGTP